MGLLLLPNELLLAIASSLEYDWDINAFSQMNHRLHDLLNDLLYQHNIHYFNGSALTWAAQHGNTSTVQKCLDGGILESTSDTVLREIMLLAVENGHAIVLQQLLEQGINRSYATEPVESAFGSNSLLRAVLDGNESAVRVLLAHGVDGGVQNDGQPLITFAAQYGHLSLVKLFVELGFDPGSTDTLQLTPLMFAAKAGHVEIVQYLLQMGADPNLQISYQRIFRVTDTAISQAASRGHTQVIHCLIEHGADVNPVAPDGTVIYPVCTAIDNRHLEAANLLLNHMDLKKLSMDRNGQAILLCIAAACGSEILVQQLLENGCHPDMTQEAAMFPFKFKQTALTWAAELGHEKIAMLLLNNGAGIDDEQGSTSRLQPPFFLAVQRGHFHVVKILLEKGVDPNHKDSLQDTALFKAIPHMAIFKLLLEYGADPTVKGSTDFLIPRLLIYGRTAHIQLLLDWGMDLSSHPGSCSPFFAGLFTPAATAGLATLEFLYQHGFKPPSPNSRDGSMAVGAAVLKPNPLALEFLLKEGYRLPQDDRLPSTISVAAEKEKAHSEAPGTLITLLLHYGLDINARDNEQRTCLFSAIARYDKDSLDLLLQKGADPLPQDQGGLTPLSCAAASGFTEGIEILLHFVGTVSQDVLEYEIMRAKSQAVGQEHWPAVRVLERFYYCNLVPQN